jgi:flagellar motor switch protein FliN/FliY
MAEEQPPVASSDEEPTIAAVTPVAPVVPPADVSSSSSVAPPEDVVPPEAPAAPAPPEVPVMDAATSADANASDEQKAIDELLKQATFEDPQSVARELPPTSNLDLPNFNQIAQDAQTSSIDLLRDVDLNVKIELGRSQMLVEDVLKLGEGSVVELDKLAGDPVDVFVNERLVARGEVLVLNDNFCVRINEIVAGVKEEGL